MGNLAKRYPRMVAGLWFGAAVLLPALALGVYYLLLVAAEGPLVLENELPVEATLAFYLVPLPVLLAFAAGAWIGAHILHSPPPDRLEASGWGALVGVVSLLFWFGLGELLASILHLAPVGDIPVGLMAFGYGLGGLGSLVLVVFDAVLGLWLQVTAGEWALDAMEDTQPVSTV